MFTNTSSFRRVTYVILVLSCPGLVQGAQFAGGTGSADHPYRIATAQQLIAVTSAADRSGRYFLLVNDIDLDPNLPGGQTFDGAVIASSAPPWTQPFVGTFNGGGHTIRNLVIRGKTQKEVWPWAGLFGGIDAGGVIRDLKIEAADVQAIDRRAGILAGENAGRIINCQVSGRVCSSSGEFLQEEAGGLVGRNTGDIIDCRADTDSVQGDGCVGGLVGSNFEEEGRIVGCRAVCQAMCARRAEGGGLVGCNFGCIIGSAALSGILVPDSSRLQGGLAGVNFGTILNCHSGSSIAAGAQCREFGGLVGYNRGEVINCYASGSISTQNQCYSIGGLIGWHASPGRVVNSHAAQKFSRGTDNQGVGGLVGDNMGGDVKMSFWDIEASGVGVSAGGQGLTTAQMQHADTFLAAGWDFVDERVNGLADTWRMPEEGGYPVLTLSFEGYDPHPLTGAGTAEAPYRIATPEDLGALWRHDPGICCQLTSNLDLAGVRWLGAPVATFSGTFNGAGFVISHLTLHESRAAGLFGALGAGAVVTDLGIADANIVAGDDAQNLGVLAGQSYNGLYVSHVTRCYATGRLSAGRRSFGLGGLIGESHSSVTDCYAKVDLSCGPKSGRLGGLLGDGYATHSYSVGAVVTPDPNMTCGGLLGAATSKLPADNCYFLTTSDGGGPNNGFGVPLTNAQMKQQASFVHWDFTNTWTICEGQDYPHLRWEKITCSQP